MRYLTSLLIVFVLAILPCLVGCSEKAAEPDPSAAAAAPTSEFESTAQKSDPDNP